MDRKQVEAKLRKLLPGLRTKYHVAQIGYFGSFSRGEQSETSDVDILIEFSKTPGWEYFDVLDLLEAELERKVDLVTPAALKPVTRERILNEVRYVA